MLTRAWLSCPFLYSLVLHVCIREEKNILKPGSHPAGRALIILKDLMWMRFSLTSVMSTLLKCSALVHKSIHTCLAVSYVFYRLSTTFQNLCYTLCSGASPQICCFWKTVATGISESFLSPAPSSKRCSGKRIHKMVYKPVSCLGLCS